MNHSYRGISLRQVLDQDMAFLFRLLTNPRRAHLWMRARMGCDEASFSELWAGWCSGVMASRFIVESSGQAIGLVFEYDRSVEDGHSKVTALLEEERTGRGGGVIATALHVDWLFHVLPLQKVYCEVYSYNPSVIGILRKLGLVEEGVLRSDRFFNGSYWDMHVLALYRRDWPRIAARLLRRQTNGKEVTGEDSVYTRILRPCRPHCRSDDRLTVQTP